MSFTRVLTSWLTASLCFSGKFAVCSLDIYLNAALQWVGESFSINVYVAEFSSWFVLIGKIYIHFICVN